MSGRRSKLVLGDTVFVAVDPRQNNGSDEAPATVTRIWENDLVNVRVLTDGPDVLWLTSLKLVDSRPEDDDEDVPRDVSGVARVVYRSPK